MFVNVLNRYEKSCIDGSINVTYSGVHLGQHELRALGLHPQKVLQEAIKLKKIVVVASAEDETAQLVSSNMYFICLLNVLLKVLFRIKA